jgi:hypothetical protein
VATQGGTRRIASVRIWEGDTQLAHSEGAGGGGRPAGGNGSRRGEVARAEDVVRQKPKTASGFTGRRSLHGRKRWTKRWINRRPRRLPGG